jgi:hypothetical protein
MDSTLVSVVGEHAPVFREMLCHYRGLGVSNYTIHSHSTHTSNNCSNLSVASDYGIEIRSNIIGPWHFALNTVLYTLSRAHNPQAWFILADQDEFQVYPDGLAAALEFCDRRGYDYIEGILIDRIASDGRLREVSGPRTLWEQYPLGGIVSGRIGGACINKIVAARGHVRLTHGQHHAISGKGCPVAAMYVPVHHFKWVESIERSMRSRSTLNAQYSAECKRIVAHLSRHGAFDISDRELLLAPCTPDYPYLDRLREWRHNAQLFSPDLAMRLAQSP